MLGRINKVARMNKAKLIEVILLVHNKHMSCTSLVETQPNWGILKQLMAISWRKYNRLFLVESVRARQTVLRLEYNIM
jgi:hypothetical protein